MLQRVTVLLLLFTAQMCSAQAAELFTFIGSSTERDITTLPPEFIADTVWTVIPNCDVVSDQASSLAIRVSRTQQPLRFQHFQCLREPLQALCTDRPSCCAHARQVDACIQLFPQLLLQFNMFKCCSRPLLSLLGERLYHDHSYEVVL
jgi:hypothetical protein